MRNGDIWLDTMGNAIHAHGGGIIKVGKYFYWYGENRLGNAFVSMYRSEDCKNWEFRNNILTCNSVCDTTFKSRKTNLTNESGGKVIIERPKILFNKVIGKFVLWGHFENGINYTEAKCCVATCDEIDGDYCYQGSFNPLGEMSRDCTLYEEDDVAYFISASNDNKDLHVYKLTKDYLDIDCQVNSLWKSKSREAPIIFKREGVYYLMTSACTGWCPNQGKYGTSTSISGEFTKLKKIGNRTTYHSQSFNTININGKQYYLGDRWNAKDYSKSTYVFLEFEFNKKGELILNYNKNFDIQI